VTGLDLGDRAAAAVFAVSFRVLLAGCAFETGRFFAATAFFLIATRFFDAETALAFFAFLAGALPVAERLVIGFKRADLPARMRLLLVDAEDCREIERNGDLLTPLTIGLLM
jgi:hypothetical protein